MTTDATMTPEEAAACVLSRGRYHGQTIQQIDLAGHRAYLLEARRVWPCEWTRAAIEHYLRTHLPPRRRGLA